MAPCPTPPSAVQESEDPDRAFSESAAIVTFSVFFVGTRQALGSIQVGTPNLGNTHFCSTNQPTMISTI